MASLADRALMRREAKLTSGKADPMFPTAPAPYSIFAALLLPGENPCGFVIIYIYN